jgi:hypothetical protein
VVTATLTLTSNGGTRAVALACTGVAPAITAAPSWVEFSTVLQGTTASRVLAITNPGTAPLTISSATVTGAPFAIATPTPFTVAVGATTMIEVRCSPSAAGHYQGTITVTHDAGAAPLAVGTGCVGVLGRITLLAPLAEMRLYPGESGTATIRNDGVGPLYVAELRFSTDAPELSFSGVTLPATLAVGETLSWQVDCAPWPWNVASSKVYAKHNGLQEGSLFAVTCGGRVDLPVDPVDPIDPGLEER